MYLLEFQLKQLSKKKPLQVCLMHVYWITFSLLQTMKDKMLNSECLDKSWYWFWLYGRMVCASDTVKNIVNWELHIDLVAFVWILSQATLKQIFTAVYCMLKKSPFSFLGTVKDKMVTPICGLIWAFLVVPYDICQSMTHIQYGC